MITYNILMTVTYCYESQTRLQNEAAKPRLLVANVLTLIRLLVANVHALIRHYFEQLT